MVALQFLGSGDAFGSGGRLQTCLLLSGGDQPILVDCGSSSLSAMKRANIEPNEIGRVMISHLHGDHFGGLPFLILDGQFRRREQPLVIGGPPGIRERVLQTMELLFPGSSSAARRFQTTFVEVPTREPIELGPARILAFEVEHSSGAPSYALRVEYGGKVVAYSGDTAWTPVLRDVAADADLFVCEAYFFEKKVRYHLDYATLRQHRAELSTRRLVLSHMSQDMLDHLEGDMEAAEDGKVIEL